MRDEGWIVDGSKKEGKRNRSKRKEEEVNGGERVSGEEVRLTAEKK